MLFHYPQLELCSIMMKFLKETTRWGRRWSDRSFSASRLVYILIWRLKDGPLEQMVAMIEKILYQGVFFNRNLNHEEKREQNIHPWY